MVILFDYNTYRPGCFYTVIISNHHCHIIKKSAALVMGQKQEEMKVNNRTHLTCQ